MTTTTTLFENRLGKVLMSQVRGLKLQLGTCCAFVLSLATASADQGRPLPGEAISRLTTGLDSSGNATHIHPVSFAPDSKTLAWPDRKDHSVRIWDVATSKEQVKLQGHQSYVLCVAYSPDGKSLASGSYDGSIRLWDLATAKTSAVLESGPPQAMIYTVAFSPDGKTLASGDWHGAVRLWDTANGKLTRTLRGGGTAGGKRSGYVQVVAFAPDGKLLATGNDSGLVQLWDVATGKERHDLLRDLSVGEQERKGRGNRISSLAFSPDGTILAAATGVGNPPIVIWDVATGKEVYKLRSDRGALTVNFSPDGKYLVSAYREMRVWELATGQVVLAIPEPRNLIYAIYSASFSPDGMMLASGGQDNAVILWDAFGLDRKKRPAGALAAKELEILWRDLSDTDAVKAYRAIGAFVALPKQTIPLAQERIKPVAAVGDPARLSSLVYDLESGNFKTREKAERELEKLGQLAEWALTKELEGKPSLEVRLRAQRLLNKLVPDNLRATRVLVALERMGTPEARQVLETLAQGEPRASLTRDARAALARLARR